MGNKGGFAPDKFTIQIPAMIVTGEDPALVGIGPIAHSVYLKLIGLCWKIGRDELTDGYLQASVLRGVLGIRDQGTLEVALRRLSGAGLVSVGNPNGIPLKFQSLRVVGLEDRLPSRVWSSGRIEENRIEEIEESVSSAKTPPTPDVDKSPRRRTRKPTEVEQAFIDGFVAKYGTVPTIGRGHATALAQLASRHGKDLVLRRIRAYWEHPAARWVAGARTIGPFLKCFDDLADGLVYKPPEVEKVVAVDLEGREKVNALVGGLAAKMTGG